MLFHFQIEGRVHGHRYSLDLLAVLNKLFEERAYSFAAVAQANPLNASVLSIHDHRRVTMAFVQGELIHHQAAHIARLETTQCGLETPLVLHIDSVPVLPGESADMTDGHELQQGLDPGTQSMG